MGSVFRCQVMLTATALTVLASQIARQHVWGHREGGFCHLLLQIPLSQEALLPVLQMASSGI